MDEGGGIPQRRQSPRIVNGVALPLDAVVLEEGRSAAGPYVLWYLPFGGQAGWKGEKAVLVFASTSIETGKGIILNKSILDRLTAACA